MLLYKKALYTTDCNIYCIVFNTLTTNRNTYIDIIHSYIDIKIQQI